MLIAVFSLIFFLLVVVGTVLILALVLISGIVSDRYGVPFVPTRKRNIRDLFIWADLSVNDIFYDLGCGDGRVIISAVKDFGIKKATGYEAAPWPRSKAKFLVWFFDVGGRIKILSQNFLEADLSRATFIYAYLSHKLVDRLAAKLTAESKLGTRILCHTFPINLGRHPEFKLLKTEKFDKITAYLYEKI